MKILKQIIELISAQYAQYRSDIDSVTEMKSWSSFMRHLKILQDKFDTRQSTSCNILVRTNINFYCMQNFLIEYLSLSR